MHLKWLAGGILILCIGAFAFLLGYPIISNFGLSYLMQFFDIIYWLYPAEVLFLLLGSVLIIIGLIAITVGILL